jgi:hypothetical protein
MMAPLQFGMLRPLLLGFMSLMALSSVAWASPPEPEAGLFPSPAQATVAGPVAPPSTVPADCGLGDGPVPDFELVDLNPYSMSLGQTYTLDTFQSQVLVIYWALAS